ncbi:caudovirus prohead protease [mine drainage metagenome]|uniref:Caudovirus prohead protease n=1 Tax=mine drainage metagenome TaxID=410659 RepID=A0A1J5P1Q2_9ZZZZ
MLWQHDPTQPIGIWDEVREDAVGLYVKGRLLPEVAKGREAVALIGAGAIEGLSIGYRTVAAEKDAKGQRLLSELDLWEVSLVTFPMLPQARVSAKAEAQDETMQDLAAVLEAARRMLAER